jgi:hypothetical protein
MLRRSTAAGMVISDSALTIAATQHVKRMAYAMRLDRDC